MGEKEEDTDSDGAGEKSTVKEDDTESFSEETKETKDMVASDGDGDGEKFMDEEEDTDSDGAGEKSTVKEDDTESFSEETKETKDMVTSDGDGDGEKFTEKKKS